MNVETENSLLKVFKYSDICFMYVVSNNFYDLEEGECFAKSIHFQSSKSDLHLANPNYVAG